MHRGDSPANEVNNRVTNPVFRYWPLLLRAGERLTEERRERIHAGFNPSFQLPDRDAKWDAYFSATPIGLHDVGKYRDHRVLFLDLMGNKDTRTTKSLASGLMVSRAICHMRDTGQRVTLVTPTSGNKGTALRAAVAKAVSLRLIEPDEVRVIVVVPRPSRGKLRAGPLDDDAEFTWHNPVFIAELDDGAEVKALAYNAAVAAAVESADDAQTVWYSLDLDNYRFADTMRAFIEAEAAPLPASGRLHVHAVSSGYGLLGHRLGREVLRAPGETSAGNEPGYFLVQHLGTPDMVLSLLNEVSRPVYGRTAPDQPYRQFVSPSFPAVTDNFAEMLDPTFYTKQPPTSATMNALIRHYGGGGIVVSRRECVDMYDRCRDFLGDWCSFPEHPNELREWSVLMAITGMMLAVDRSLIPDGTQLVVHGSGSYWDDVLPPMAVGQALPIASVAALAEAISSRMGRYRGAAANGAVHVWFNQACNWSRITAQALESAGCHVVLRDYLSHPPTRIELSEVLARLQTEPWDLARLTEPVAEEIGMATWPREPSSRHRWLDAMTAHPILIQRPIVLAETGPAAVPRSDEVLHELVRRISRRSGTAWSS
jgi:arsenate reductase-like glutaredoxin family protein